MNPRLEGRAAIVTGASRGLGRATALALAADGAGVAVVARTERVWDDRLPGTIAETVDEIVAAGGSAVAIRADLTDRADLPRLVDQARDALGPITILVNNAAFTAPGRPPKPGSVRPEKRVGPANVPAPQADWPPFVGTPAHAFRRHFEIGVFAAYELMQLVVPDMIAAGAGAIVNISSIASRIPGDGPYRDFSRGTLPGYGALQGRPGAPDRFGGLRAAAAKHLGQRAVPVTADDDTRIVLLPNGFRRRRFAGRTFAEAVVRLALVDPDVVTGRTIGHREVLDGSFAPFAP